MDDIIPLRQCVKCKKDFPATNQYFYRDRTIKCGLHPYCKDCHKIKGVYPPNYASSKDKICGKCKQAKPATPENFSKCIRNLDGLDRICRQCKSKAKPKEHIPNGFKKCCTCHEIKPATFDFFSKNKTNPDGFQAYCKQCRCTTGKPRGQQSRIDPSTGLKSCCRCSQFFPATLEYFYPHKVIESGLYSYCKKCANKIAANHTRHRRALARKAGGKHTLVDVQNQYDLQEGKCFYCKILLGDVYQVDHYIPLTRGGSNGPENIVIACPLCNLRKNNKLPHEFRAL